MKLSIPEQHQLKIARRTLFELSDTGVLVLGGMTKDEAETVIERNGTKSDRTQLGIETNVRIYDNGGESFDRYTAVYLNESAGNGMFNARGMSANPNHPQGFGQLTSAMDGEHLGKRIEFDELPIDCQNLVKSDYTGV